MNDNFANQYVGLVIIAVCILILMLAASEIRKKVLRLSVGAVLLALLAIACAFLATITTLPAGKVAWVVVTAISTLFCSVLLWQIRHDK